MLLCYEIIAGVPTFIMGYCDPAVAQLTGMCVGIAGGKDTLHVATNPIFGDDWSGGDFTNPEAIDLPRFFGGEIFKDGSTWQNEMLVGTSTAGIRGGGSIISVAWLCVAGGGGSGAVIGGGGGGGGVKYGTFTMSGTLTCVVGPGGAGGINTSGTAATPGGNTSITGTALTQSTTGGGRGSGTNFGFPAGNGGSGGGGRGFNTETGGTGIGGEGFAGGNGVSGQFNAAGGGGAGAAAANANVNYTGGAGKQWPTASGGDNQYYGGGGGGGIYGNNLGTNGLGGIGGGGNGGDRSGHIQTAGGDRTGGGGGGAGHNDSGASGDPNGRNGGSGVVKFRSQNSNWSP